MPKETIQLLNELEGLGMTDDDFRIIHHQKGAASIDRRRLYYREEGSFRANAPKQMVNSEDKRSFEQTLATGIGRGYAIAHNLWLLCRPGCSVVLLSKDEGKRAEGTLLKLVPTEKAGNGIQRYDVHIDGLRPAPYQPEALNRNGVAVR